MDWMKSYERMQELQDKYPGILKRAFPDVGSGWFDILDNLCAVLQEATQHPDGPVQAAQVKEKFGTLRFYAWPCTDEHRAMIRLAEALSGSTCEYCGQQGKLRNDHAWLKTLCDECSVESNSNKLA